MVSSITPEQLQEVRHFLEEYPIDHRYDDPPNVITLDGDMPPEQIRARLCDFILQEVERQRGSAEL